MLRSWRKWIVAKFKKSFNGKRSFQIPKQWLEGVLSWWGVSHQELIIWAVATFCQFIIRYACFASFLHSLGAGEWVTVAVFWWHTWWHMFYAGEGLWLTTVATELLNGIFTSNENTNFAINWIISFEFINNIHIGLFFCTLWFVLNFLWHCSHFHVYAFNKSGIRHYVRLQWFSRCFLHIWMCSPVFRSLLNTASHKRITHNRNSALRKNTMLLAEYSNWLISSFMVMVMQKSIQSCYLYPKKAGIVMLPSMR